LHVHLTDIGMCMDQKQTRSEMVTWETYAKLVDLTRNDPYSCNFSIPGDL